MTDTLKKYDTIGCCGIDCGLCPRFHTKGSSACPGCGGVDFKLKHPSCGFVTCCVLKRGLETCANCTEYPCKRFDAEKEGCDSFVTHRNVFSNLDEIKTGGMDAFLMQQNSRIAILLDFLVHYDDSRSKSFFCLSCTLLPLKALIEAQEFISHLNEPLDEKEKTKRLKEKLLQMAEPLHLDLKLKTKK